MCQLLGMSFNRPVTADFSLRWLENQVDGDPMYRNRNGWGIALFEENAALVIKEPLSATTSSLFQSVRTLPLRSSTFLAHIRFSTKGLDALKNTHPFQREAFGRDVVFAHNGTLSEAVFEMETGRYRPVGNTDSEQAFLHLLHSAVTAEGVDVDRLQPAIKRVNACGEFNFLLADGDVLYAYHCRTGYKGLYLLQRTPPHSPSRLMDEDFLFDFTAPDYQDEAGFVVASTPLTDEHWEPFQPGELQVFYQGQRIARYQVQEAKA
jgi:predicted glutamine amidotransferase